jgi:hypothetical protein
MRFTTRPERGFISRRRGHGDAGKCAGRYQIATRDRHEPGAVGVEAELPLLAESRALIPRDGQGGVGDAENRDDFLIHWAHRFLLSQCSRANLTRDSFTASTDARQRASRARTRHRRIVMAGQAL